ncbi:MAG: inorganic phosphate transporter [Thermoanaerobaculia bacterium]
MAILVLALAALLAFANGANDNGKGVATLVGHGAASPRLALGWAAITTALGALVGILASDGLVRAFRAGFVGDGAELPPRFFAAALAGAVAWVLFATRSGLPVSTTHAILGGLVGAGLYEVGAAQIGWAVLAQKAALPLLASPLVALALVFAAAQPLAALARRTESRCLCAVETLEPLGAGEVTVARSRLAIVTGDAAGCAVHSPTASMTGRGVAQTLHWGTSGLVGFARGWNDTPKIAALALVVLPAGSGTFGAFVLVAAAMALGGLFAGRRVLTTLSERITAMPLGESLAASGVSSILVGLASWQGLSVSTTHVTTGGIVGAGIARSAQEVRWPVVRDVALSWIVTLPAAAVVALLAGLALNR